MEDCAPLSHHGICIGDKIAGERGRNRVFCAFAIAIDSVAIIDTMEFNCFDAVFLIIIIGIIIKRFILMIDVKSIDV